MLAPAAPAFSTVAGYPVRIAESSCKNVRRLCLSRDASVPAIFPVAAAPFDNSFLFSPMNTEYQNSFNVLGVEVETTNAQELNGNGAIAGLWRTIAANAEPLVAVYSEYESNRDGRYRYLLGTKVTEPPQTVDARRVRATVAGEYWCLSVAGPITPRSVVEAWRKVWALEDAGELRRAYATDYELYTDGGMKLHIGTRR